MCRRYLRSRQRLEPQFCRCLGLFGWLELEALSFFLGLKLTIFGVSGGSTASER
jgi:hypothetical protein